MFCVYILQSMKDGKFYVGYTDNLKKRLRKHNEGKVFSTKSRRPLCCIYVEICLNAKDAKQREKYLKTGVGKRFLKQRLSYHLKGQRFSSTENT